MWQSLNWAVSMSPEFESEWGFDIFTQVFGGSDAKWLLRLDN